MTKSTTHTMKSGGEVLLLIATLASLTLTAAAQVAEPDPVFEFGFVGIDSASGQPGEEIPFSINAQLMTLNAPERDRGAEAFSMGIRISGGCAMASTREELQADVISHLAAYLGKDFVPDFLEVEVSEEGVTLAVVLDFETRVTLDPLGSPHNIFTLRLKGKVPVGAPCASCFLQYTDGLPSGGRPLRNVVTSRITSIDPRLGAKSVEFRPPSCTGHALLSEAKPFFDFPALLTGCSRTACLPFTVDPSVMGKPVLVRLSDPAAQNSNTLFLKRGEPAGPGSFDLRSGGRGVSSPRLVLPAAASGDWYAAVDSDVKTPTSVTLRLEVLDLSLQEILPRRGAQGTEASVVVLGGGFRQPEEGRATTFFRLVPSQGGDPIDPLDGSVTIVSSGRAEMVFDLGGHAMGSYRLEGYQEGVPDPLDSIEKAFEIGPPLGHGLEVKALLEVVYGRDRASRLTLHYQNNGDEPVTAPLFKVHVEAPETAKKGIRMRLDRECAYQEGGELLVLGINPDGLAGRLAPGAGYDLPIVFESAESGKFRLVVSLFTPRRSERIGWETVPAPSGVKDWEAARPRLAAMLGGFWQEYHQALATLATRLSRRGREAASVAGLYLYAIEGARGTGPAAALGRVVHRSTHAPLSGVVVSAAEDGTTSPIVTARTDRNGDFALEGLFPGRTYRFRVQGDSATDIARQVPQEGDLYGLELAVDAPAEDPAQQCWEREIPADGPPALAPLSPPLDLFSPLASTLLNIVTSVDPNDKRPPPGQPGPDPLEQRTYVEPGEDLLYGIGYLNTGDAPAHRVVITDRLRPELDETTLRFREVDFGERAPVSLDNRGSDRFSGYHRSRFHEGFTVPVRPFYQGQYWDNLMLSAEVSYQPETRVITWTLKTLECPPGSEPTACAEPVEFQKGFLPPEKCPPELEAAGLCPPEELSDRGIGEGLVSYTVQVREGLDDDEEVENDALINFDGQLDFATKPVAENLYSTGLPPAVPQLRVPKDGELVDPPVVLRWERPAFAISYELRLWRIADPGPDCGGTRPEPQVIQLPRRLDTAYAPAGGLEHDTCYHWQLVAKNLHGAASESEIRSFRTTPRPPECPGKPVLDPTCRRTTCGEPWVLSWAGGERAAGFLIYFSREADWPPPEPRFRVDGREFRLPTIDAPGRYRWRVEAVNEVCLPTGSKKGIPSDEVGCLEIPACFIRGEVQLNGSIDLSDAVALLGYKYLGDAEPECLDAADVNDDGQIDVTDGINLLNWLFMGGAAPPPPRECGNDPTTETGIGCRQTQCPLNP